MNYDIFFVYFICVGTQFRLLMSKHLVCDYMVKEIIKLQVAIWEFIRTFHDKIQCLLFIS